MIRRTYLGLSLLLALAVAGCDVVEAPYKETPGGPGPNPEARRNILIEDFTGFKCPNCPAAADIAKELEELYGDQIYVLSIHAGSYAKPDPIGSFVYDFRNETATDLATFFEVPQYPNGMINRIVPQDAPGRMTESTQWRGIVGALLDSTADMSIGIENEYNATTRSLTVNIDLDYINDQAADNYLAVYIVEDSIVQPQIDNRKPLDQQKVLDYVHNHVLRGSVNGKWWGERISEMPIEAGADISRSYTITLKDDWRPEHCKVLVYVHRYDPSYSVSGTNAGEFEVLQVEGADVIK